MNWERLYSFTVIILLIGYILLAFPLFEPFPSFTAEVTSSVLHLIGVNSSAVDNVLVSEGFNPLNVTLECSGIILVLVFIVTIHVLPVMELGKKAGSLLLIPGIFLGNVLRLAMSVVIGEHFGQEAMQFFHFSIGQVFVFAWTIALYIAWLKVLDIFPGEEFSKPLLGIK
jgi:exosortase/archaeosortase family protein